MYMMAGRPAWKFAACSMASSNSCKCSVSRQRCGGNILLYIVHACTCTLAELSVTDAAVMHDRRTYMACLEVAI